VNDPDMPHQISNPPSGTAGHDAVEPTLGPDGDAVTVAAQGRDVIGWLHTAAMGTRADVLVNA
jgi:hypothetical protein